jgi:IS1 family transposase
MPSAPATTPTSCTTSWWAFPPNTHNVQFDEKWSFVGKKQKHCDLSNPADDFQGDHWDHVAFDPDHRLVVSLVCGQRTEEHTLLLVQDFHDRTEGRLMDLMTSDEYALYASAIHEVYGQDVVPERTGKPGRPKAAYRDVPAELNYATVHKEREGGRVVSVEARVVYGAAESKTVSTSYIERFNGTDRHRNSRKVRKTYGFSKDWEVHQAMTAFVTYSYNFCWPVRTLRVRGEKGGWDARTPAMAAGLANHVWSLREWVTFPGIVTSRMTVNGS